MHARSGVSRLTGWNEAFHRRDASAASIPERRMRIPTSPERAMENFVSDHRVACDGGRTAHDFAASVVAEPVVITRGTPGAGAGLSDKALERTIAYIEAHLFEDLSLGDLARTACVSRFHFARMFRVRTGFSPMKYVQHERIRIAKLLLRSGDRNISSVAAALGFFDQSHFSRVFRKITGMSPGRYAQCHAPARRTHAPVR